MNPEILAMTKRLDEACRQLQAEHMAALARLSEGVAHEINNPLAYISLATVTIPE